MCGIFGLIRTDRSPIDDHDRVVMNAQLATLAKRGPDAEGLYVEGHVGVGHRRLSIRDREHGGQPWTWSGPNGNCVLVYNGELYNDESLRRELASDYEFTSTCDTELVMASYLRWGKRCVHKFVGMFAFAIFDFRDSSFWLVRDRLGVKPVYFAHAENRFIFASQPSTILCDPAVPKQPDWHTVSHYLTTTRLTLGSRSMFDGVRLLQPAEELTLRDSRVATRRYWHYPTVDTKATYDEALEEFESTLEESVACRMVSDVPVGLFLSGGVDSCTIASLVHRLDQRCRLAFCATSTQAQGQTVEELSHARTCADYFNYQLTPVLVDAPEYLETWLELIRAFRLPLSTPSDVVIHRLSRVAKSHVGVVLGGEGADELLGGYEVTSWSGFDYDATRTNRCPQAKLDSIMRQYGRISFRNESDHYFSLNSLIPPNAKRAVLSQSIGDFIDSDSFMMGHYQSNFDDLGDLSTVEKQARILHRINLESLLSRLDATTMHAGLEARVPYTDHRLVEKVFRLPFQYRIDAVRDSHMYSSGELSAASQLRSKRLLRDVASKRLPSSLAKRRKASFPTGLKHWIQNNWRSMLSDYLTDSPFAQFFLSDGFRSEIVQKPELAGMWLWPIANLAIWGDQEFFKSSSNAMEPRNPKIQSEKTRI